LIRVLFEAFARNGIDLVTLSVPAVERASIKLYENWVLNAETIFFGIDLLISY
jgi:hypothetical protein